MVKFYLTKTPSQTKKLGEILAKEILKRKSQKAVVIGLVGELGGGKTTFLQGFAKGLGIKGKILSPTFIILKKFEIPPQPIFNRLGRPAQNFGLWRNPKPETNPKFKNSKFKTFYHIDCYRIQKPEEILDLGFKEIISNSQNIVAAEWADRIRKILPKNTIVLKFKFIDESKRKIMLEFKNG